MPKITELEIERSRRQVDDYIAEWERQSPAPRLVIPDHLPRPKWIAGDVDQTYEQRQTAATRYHMDQTIVAQSVILLLQWRQLRATARHEFVQQNIDTAHWHHILKD